MSVSKAVQHAGNQNWPMVAIELAPRKAFARIYRARTGHDLRRVNDLWRLDTGRETWWLPRAQDALRITHIGVNPRRRVVEKYLGNAPWDRSAIETVIDVGAYVGEFVRRGGFDGLAIEADSRNARCLRRNVPDGVDVANTVAWHTGGSVEFVEAGDGSESGVGSPDGGGSVATAAREANTVTRLAESYGLGGSVDLVKVDAEGFEPEVLAGAVGLNTRFAVDVGPERGGHRTASASQAVLESHGFATAVVGDILYADPAGRV